MGPSSRAPEPPLRAASDIDGEKPKKFLKFAVQNSSVRIVGNRIYATNTNASTPAHQVAEGQSNINSFSGTSNGYGWAQAYCDCILKVTNTTNDKVAFWWQSSETSNVGAGYGNMVVFFKIADLN